MSLLTVEEDQPLGLPGPILEHLRASGLSDSYIAAMRIAAVEEKNLKGEKVLGYRIPYFNPDGSPTNHYRDRWLRDHEPRYTQPAAAGNHLYIPPNWLSTLKGLPKSTPIQITEGEKKAAKATQEGFPTLGLGGVDSWRTRTFEVVNAKIFTPDPKITRIQFTKESSDLEMFEEKIAPELLKLLDFLRDRTILLAYDTEAKNKTNAHVQLAAFNFALWLIGNGIEDVRQIRFPIVAGRQKIGLDDYLVAEGADAYTDLVNNNVWHFPTHPDVRNWITRRLDNPKIKRTDYLMMARAVIAELDRRGKRFVDETGTYYYFDEQTKILHTFRWDAAEIRNLRVSSFGQFLFTELGVSASDASVLGRIADAFISTRGIQHITPRRVVYSTTEAVYYQISNSRMVRVTADRVEGCDNGEDGVLFLSDIVDEIDDRLVIENFQNLKRKRASYAHKGLRAPKTPWIKILENTQIQPMYGLSIAQTRLVIAALFYMSPWLRGWRPPNSTNGLMLPLELTIAEPNSGKTVLYNLRTGILLGRSMLNHAPVDLRSWYSSLIHAPALWVGDNIGSLSKELRNQLSDELCRLITEPNPAIRMRKLYTTAEEAEYPIDCCFAVTSVSNPFTREDLLQRSVVISMSAIPMGKRDSNFFSRQLSGDGRAKWIADHLEKVQLFLKLVPTVWNEKRLSNHRLAHFEQALVIMGEVLGEVEDMAEVVQRLTGAIQETISTNNPVLECLRAFSDSWYDEHDSHLVPKRKGFTTQDISDWAQTNEEYRDVYVAQSSRQLAKYMQSHAYDIEQAAGIQRTEQLRHGKVLYLLKPRTATEYQHREEPVFVS